MIGSSVTVLGINAGAVLLPTSILPEVALVDVHESVARSPDVMVDGVTLKAQVAPAARTIEAARTVLPLLAKKAITRPCGPAARPAAASLTVNVTVLGVSPVVADASSQFGTLMMRHGTGAPVLDVSSYTNEVGENGPPAFPVTRIGVSGETTNAGGWLAPNVRVSRTKAAISLSIRIRVTQQARSRSELVAGGIELLANSLS